MQQLTALPKPLLRQLQLTFIDFPQSKPASAGGNSTIGSYFLALKARNLPAFAFTVSEVGDQVAGRTMKMVFAMAVEEVMLTRQQHLVVRFVSELSLHCLEDC